ncbi:MAG: TniQ family protein [Methylotenera sp.]|nr:TniQ family protein [Methylotenera sp.]MDD4927420.1 TniQ family protein [Methylotenera sp.]
MQFHMPAAMPNENLYGLVSRFAKINGMVNHLQATQCFLHSQDISVADAMLIPHEESLYKQYYASNTADPLLTLEKLRIQLGELPDNDSVSAPSRKSTLQNESFGDTSFWRYCPACYEHDVAVYGVGYWHLAHQLPTTLMCTEHRCNLHEIMLKKKHLHDRLWLIHDGLLHQNACNSALDEHWLSIAQIGKEALDDSQIPHGAEVIKQTLITALRQRGLIDGKGGLKVNVFETSFLTFFGEGFISTLKQRLLIKKPRYLATELLQGFKGRALNRLILVYWLFGTWPYFKMCCDWHAVFNTGDVTVHPSNQRIIKQPDEVKTKSRALCESYLLSTDKPNRIEFCRMFYSDFRWLLNHDRAWFDRALPAHGFSHQTKLRF